MSPEQINKAIREYVATNGISQPLKELEQSVDKVFSPKYDSSPWGSIYGI